MSEIERLLEQAQEQRDAGKPEAAIWLYRAILALDVNHAEASAGAGVLEIAAGETEEGLAHLRHAIELAPTVIAHRVTLIEHLLDLQRVQEARDVFVLLDVSAPPPELFARIQALQARLHTRTSVSVDDSAPADTADAEGRWTIELHDGLRLCMPADIECRDTYILLEQEQWPDPEISLYPRLLQPGMTCLDLGAGYGVHALAMARAVGDSGQVLAQEADTAKSRMLERSCAENHLQGRIRVLSTALSGLDGWTHDDTVPPEGTIDLVRVGDPQQALELLSHSTAFLAARTPLVLFAYAGEDLRAGWAALLQALGWECYRQIPALGMLRPCALHQPLDTGVHNLFACAPARAESLRTRGILIRTGRAS